MLGVLGYFGALPGGEIFTKFGRAAGAFQDPNVFGPFLTLPGIYLLHRTLTGSVARMPLFAFTLLIIVAGIFLSFSRGAWGLFFFFLPFRPCFSSPACSFRATTAASGCALSS
jgi:hypothetical protein